MCPLDGKSINDVTKIEDDMQTSTRNTVGKSDETMADSLRQAPGRSAGFFAFGFLATPFFVFGTILLLVDSLRV